MGFCDCLQRVLTLDHLYSLEHTRGRVNWLIFIIFKVMVPVLLIIVTQTDEIRTYGNSMMTHYKTSMKNTCLDIKYVESLLRAMDIKSLYQSTDDYILNQLLHQERKISGPGPRKWTNVPDTPRPDKELKANLKSYLTVLQSANLTSPMQYDQMEEEYKDIKKLTKEAVMCMKKKDMEKGNDIPFGVAMFFPCFGAILVAIILAPFKHIPTVQSKFITAMKTLRPNQQNTTEDSLNLLKGCIHFCVDLITFYLVLYKIRCLGNIIGPCVKNKLCLVKYTSMQLVYLLAIAQTPWISMLWNFVH